MDEEREDVRLLCAGGFRAALERLRPGLESACGRPIAAHFGAPARTQEALVAGEPFDVGIVVAATLDGDAARRIVPETRRRIAVTPIGLGLRAGAAPATIATIEEFRSLLGSLGTLGLSDPAVGTPLATQVLAAADRLGFGDEIRARVRWIAGPGSVVSAETARGAVDAVITLASEIAPVPGVRYIGPLPSELQTEYAFDGAVLSGARAPQRATALLDFLHGPEARAAMRELGLEPA